MEKLIADIGQYAAAVGWRPEKVLRLAVSASWGTWEAWKAGKSSPTVAVADRIYAYMAENPPAGAEDPEKDVA